MAREERERERERRQEDRGRARFSYANNNHNNGFAYHRAVAPPRSHPLALRSATPWRARQERDRIPWSRGRAQCRANTSLPPFSRSIGTDERRDTKRSTTARLELAWFFGTVMGGTVPLTRHGCSPLTLAFIS